MLWLLKMLIETPRAILEYRRDYYNQKKIKKTIKVDGIIEGFYLHDEIYSASAEEWLVLCDFLSNSGKEIPEKLITMARDRGWISMKPDEKYQDDEAGLSDTAEIDNSSQTWEEWENA